jgi:hypothetical protein
MRRLVAAVGLVVLVTIVIGLAAGSASAAGQKKLVEGTVYDTTGVICATCAPECPPPPHCGPITQSARAKVVCALRARRLIVCPLAQGSVVCVQAEGCPGSSPYPVYSGEGAIVKVRKRGSSTVLITVPIVEGHFKVQLPPGRYMVRPFLPEPQCWAGPKIAVWVSLALQGPVPSSLYVSNSCVAHPDAATK